MKYIQIVLVVWFSLTLNQVNAKNIGNINTACSQKITGVVYAKSNKGELAYAKVILKDFRNNVIKTFITYKDAKYSFTLKCNKKYIIEVSRQGFNSSEQTINTSEKGDDLIRDFYLDVFSEKEPFKPALKKMKFEKNKWVLSQPDIYQLDKAMQMMIDNPKLIVYFESHTDTRGDEELNKNLSKKRIEVLTNYMKKRISTDRVFGEAFGSSEPFNHCTKGVKCSESEHMQNRRTTFILYEGN